MVTTDKGFYGTNDPRAYFATMDLEIGWRACAWVISEWMYGMGALEEPGERLPS